MICLFPHIGVDFKGDGGPLQYLERAFVPPNKNTTVAEDF